MKPVYFVVPVETPSVANLREHWTAKSGRTKKQRDAARLLCPAWKQGPMLSIRLVRVSPRELDTDNLASALKACRDGIASRLKIDDGTPLVRWDYGQEKGKASVRVEIREVSEDTE